MITRSTKERGCSWLDGEVDIETAGAERVSGGVGLLLEFAPNERQPCTRDPTRGCCCYLRHGRGRSPGSDDA